ncbi:MAG TPA: cob(I)yrinic acid a,c-diamide adenosyltransferase [Patescibacteria group bacterium]|nr:cob(I)yrinic acid a,c-diamide adenosyltransferase [Patescibacteria group bacterium]
MKNQGLTQVYTGDGKGKTTAALGLALRALGWNKKVCMIQFIKGDKKIGEIKISKNYLPHFSIHQFSKDTRFILKANKSDQLLAQKTLKHAEKVINSKKFDIVILDEINIAMSLKLITINSVLEIIKSKPKKLELILTGRNAPQKIIDAANLVTEMKMIKHPYYKNIPARKGIDF